MDIYYTPRSFENTFTTLSRRIMHEDNSVAHRNAALCNKRHHPSQ